MPFSTVISVRSRPGPPQGSAGGLPRARDETGGQNAVRPRFSFLLVGQFEKMTGRDDKMPSVLILKFPGLPLFQYICIGIIRAEQRLVFKILNSVWKTSMRAW